MAESTIPDERVLDVLRASAVFGRLQESVLQDLRRLLVLHSLLLNQVFARAIYNLMRRAAQIAEAGYRYAMQEIATGKAAEQEAG